MCEIHLQHSWCATVATPVLYVGKIIAAMHEQFQTHCGRAISCHVTMVVGADGDGVGVISAADCLWSHLPAQPLPAQQLWDPVLPPLPVPAVHGFLCIPVFHLRTQGVTDHYFSLFSLP